MDHSTKTKSHKQTDLTCSQYNEMYNRALHSHAWLLDIERFIPSEYHPEDLECIPEIGLDDGNESDEEGSDGRRMTLTLTNVQNVTNICFVTVWDVDLCGRDGVVLQSGWNETQQDDIRKRRKCTTFIVLCPPQTFVHLCYLAPHQFLLCDSDENDEDNSVRVPLSSWSQVEIESDIQPWSSHENINDEHSTLIHFPFKGLAEEPLPTHDNERSIASIEQKSCYQCIQSENGQLTHFFHGNYHAIDFACPIGTPLYSPVNGVVIHVCDNAQVSGIAATNLFHWNSILIRADEASNDNSFSKKPLYIEYVHIQSKSCVIQPGESVTKGQLLCKSGSVGFSPTPHLHLGAYRSGGDGAASVRVRFELYMNEGRDSFLPVAGGWYDEFGLVQENRLGS